MGKPTIYQTLRQVVGRAFRETGQALDRAGIKGQQMAVTTRVIGDDPVIYQDHLSRHRQQMPLLRRGKPVVAKNVAFLAPCATLIGSVHIGAGSSVFYKSILRADNCDNAEAFSRSHDDDDDSALALDKGESSGSSSGKDGEPGSPSSSAATTSGELVPTIEDEDEHTLQEHQQLQPPRHPCEWDLDPDRTLRSNSTATGGGIFVGENTNIQDGCIIDAKTNHTRIGNGVTIGHLASIHSATVHDHCLIGMGSLLQEGVIVCEESFVAAGANIAKGTVVGPGELWVGSPARKVRDLTAEERERLHYQADAYVEVASALKENMLLGGNLPESLSQYMYCGHDGEDYDEYEYEYDSGYEEDYESSGDDTNGSGSGSVADRDTNPNSSNSGNSSSNNNSNNSSKREPER